MICGAVQATLKVDQFAAFIITFFYVSNEDHHPPQRLQIREHPVNHDFREWCLIFDQVLDDGAERLSLCHRQAVLLRWSVPLRHTESLGENDFLEGGNGSEAVAMHCNFAVALSVPDATVGTAFRVERIEVCNDRILRNNLRPQCERVLCHVVESELRY